MGNKHNAFREKLTNRDTLVGTFVKTPSSIIAEVLALSDLDVFCIDTEHAPFGRLELDQTIAAFRYADKPVLVRTADDSPREIRNALDCGATGIVVPHVTSADQARAIVKAAHFGDGGRGYAGSPRAAGYTTKAMVGHIADSRAQTTVIVQIEDTSALDNVSEIAAVDGVDCLFIGRVDLAVALQKGVSDPEVLDAVEKICSDAHNGATAIGMFTPNAAELPQWQSLGASFFLLSSDQSMLLAGANALAQSRA
jgi:2-keto-3-deoxy-L-rhamnonate aldolase RhmA